MPDGQFLEGNDGRSDGLLSGRTERWGLYNKHQMRKRANPERGRQCSLVRGLNMSTLNGLNGLVE